MADTLPPELTERLAAAWSNLSAPTRALLIGIVDAATTPDSALEARIQKMIARYLADTEAAVQGQTTHGSDDTLAALALTGEPPRPDPNAWERIVGAFDKYPDLEDWWATGRAIREAERPPE